MNHPPSEDLYNVELVSRWLLHVTHVCKVDPSMLKELLDTRGGGLIVILKGLEFAVRSGDSRDYMMTLMSSAMNLVCRHLLYRYVVHRVLTTIRRVEALQLESYLPMGSDLPSEKEVRGAWFALKKEALRRKDMLAHSEYIKQRDKIFLCDRPLVSLSWLVDSRDSQTFSPVSFDVF